MSKVLMTTSFLLFFLFNNFASPTENHSITPPNTKIKKATIRIPVASGCKTSHAGQGTIAANPAECFGDAFWQFPERASGAPDNINAYVSGLEDGESSFCMRMGEFDMKVPCNATITGITINIIRRNQLNNGWTDVIDVYDEIVKLYLPYTGATVTDLADTTTPWLETSTPTTYETATYNGGMWGSTLTPDIVNHDLFGVVLKINASGTATTNAPYPTIDAIEIEACYTVPDDEGELCPIALDTITYVPATCDGIGCFTIVTEDDNAPLEYSMDGGTTWQSSNTFCNLDAGEYLYSIRYMNAGCEWIDYGYGVVTIEAQNRILGIGDAVHACQANGSNGITLAVHNIQPFGNAYNNGVVGVDISSQITTPYSWTTGDLGGEVFHTSFDQDLNIYSGLTALYNLLNTESPTLIKIDGVTGAATNIATLPGNYGLGGIEYDTLHNQIFAVNMEDGIIYRVDPNTGTTLSTHDPMGADDGVAGWAPLGERLLAVTYNYLDNRVYYSVWANDAIDNGVYNTIRSVALDANGAFLPATDVLEITLPFYSDQLVSNKDYSAPVADIEFNDAGTSILLSEVGFNSSVPSSSAHEARVLRYDGATTAWTQYTTLPAGNTYSTYEIGTYVLNQNSRGGIDWAYEGLNANGGITGEETFIVVSADALNGATCTGTAGCTYGLQYLPATGGTGSNSVHFDDDRINYSSQKAVFGDVDVVTDSRFVEICCPEISDAPDIILCNGDSIDLIEVTTTHFENPDSIAFVYFDTLQTDSTLIYTNGIGIDTVQIAAGSNLASISDINIFSLSGTTPDTFYIYALLHPALTSDCLPYDEIMVIVSPVDTFQICDNGTNYATLEAPSGATDVIWFNSADLQIGTGTSVIIDVNTPGMADGIESFYFTSTDGNTCPTGSCCPVTIELEDCCQPDICLPVNITMKRGSRN